MAASALFDLVYQVTPFKPALLLRNRANAQQQRQITQHIRTLRVNRARELLESTNQPCAEIAYDLGFADQSYFIKQFREMTGTTPARYRQARQ